MSEQQELARIQQLLDEKKLNPNTLNEQQVRVLDSYFQSGKLKGYNSVLGIAQERDNAKEKLISDAEEQRNPGGKTNFGYVITGDLIGSTVPYVMDRKKLIKAAENFKDTENYRVSQSKFGKLIGGITERLVGRKLKGVRNIFKNTSDFFSRSADGARKFVFSQAGATEAKSIVGGTLGAGAGAAAFEYEQYKDGLTKSAFFDLSQLSKRDIDQMSPMERATTAVLSEMANAAFYNLAGTAIMPILAKSLKTIGKPLFGINGKEAYQAAKTGVEQGIELNAVELASISGPGVFRKLVSGFPTTLGQVPIISSSLLKQREKQQTGMTQQMLKHLTKNFGPIYHQHILSKEMYSTILQNHRLFRNTIHANYEQLLNRAELIGNPAIIPTTNLKEVAESIINKRDDMRAPNVAGIQSDIIAKIDELKSIGGYANDAYLTPKQFLGTIENLNETILQATLKNPNDRNIQYYSLLRGAMETDLGLVGGRNYSKEFLQTNQAIKKEYDSILSSEGAEAAQAYLTKTSEDLANWGEHLNYANKYFADVTGAVEGQTAIKEGLRLYDENLLTVASLQGFQGGQKEALSKMHNRIMNMTVRNGAAEDVAETKLLFGQSKKVSGDITLQRAAGKIAVQQTTRGAKPLDLKKSFTREDGVVFNPQDLKVAAEKQNIGADTLWDRMVGRSVTDAFLSSFEKINRETFSTLKNTVGIKQITEANRSKMINKVYDDDYIDKHLPNFVGGEAFGKGMRKELAKKAPGQTFAEAGGEAAENLMIKDASAHKNGIFNYANFEEALGFNQAGAKERWIEIFGGGKQGAKQYDDFNKLMMLLRTKSEISYGDVSTFLSRRLQLGGLGSIAGGGALAGGFATMGGGTTLALLGLFWGFGRAIMSPKFTKTLLDLASPEERVAKAAQLDKFFGGKLGIVPTPKKRQALIRLINQIREDDPAAFNGDYAPDVTEEQLVEYLTSGRMLVPNTDDIKPEDYNSKFKDTFMPVETAIEKTPIGQKENVASYFTGLNEGVERTYAGRTFTEQQDLKMGQDQTVAMQETQPEAPAPEPSAPVQIGKPAATQTAQTEMPQIQYENVFPNDPLGELIAKRNQLRRNV
jgi:hypothetical protein